MKLNLQGLTGGADETYSLASSSLTFGSFASLSHEIFSILLKILNPVASQRSQSRGTQQDIKKGELLASPFFISWRAVSELRKPFSSKPKLIDSIEFLHTPLYKEKCFLTQKYVIEGLSIGQIASQIFSSKDAVRRGLLTHNIPIRPKGNRYGNTRQIKYGEQKRKGKIVKHMGEERVIETIKEMHSQNLSLRQIAKCLNTIGIPTKRRGQKWHPQMIKRILNMNR